MAGGVLSPASRAGPLKLRPLGVQSFVTAGTYTVTAPRGTRFIRMDLRGGGGAGSYGQKGGGGLGGGQGAVQRVFVKTSGAPFTVTVGAGGAYNASARSSGTASSALGLTAAGGTGGVIQTGGYGQGRGGVGTDGLEATLAFSGGFSGYGNFSGRDASNSGGAGAGEFGGISAEGDPVWLKGKYGCGGAGGPTRADYATSGGAGGDGYCYLEFFG